MMLRSAPALLAALLPLPLPAQPAAARTRTLEGQLVRIDLSQAALTLKVLEGEPREYELAADAATRCVRSGRELRLAELGIGERAVVVFEEDERGRRLLRLVKLGRSDYAVPPLAASKPKRP